MRSNNSMRRVMADEMRLIDRIELNENNQFIGYERLDGFLAGLMLIGVMTLSQVYDSEQKVYATEHCSDIQKVKVKELNAILQGELR